MVRRSASQSLLTDVRRFTSAAHTTFRGSLFLRFARSSRVSGRPRSLARIEMTQFCFALMEGSHGITQMLFFPRSLSAD